MEESDGVLLYYKYAPVPDVAALVSFYESNCRSLGLVGRVRIAPDGVNVTMSSLEKHIEVMRSDRLFEGTDFKLASCDGPSDEKIATECGFTDLSVRVVKELVTFRSDPSLKSPEISHAGRHLSAAEFHSVLQDAGKTSGSQTSMQQQKLLLLDARNLYETRIGKFQNPNVGTLDPEIRQYSDLPAWIDEHSEQLQGKNVLMYCTGGIRCEMASAYIRSKGCGYENVFQLYGGIQRYLEQFPDGGFFKGKNFVFDHRVSVGSQDTDILGACLICGTSFDDYSSRCRCSYCRMLVLVCYSCQKHRKGSRPQPCIKDDRSHSADSPEAAEVETAFSSLHVSPSSIISGTYGKGSAMVAMFLEQQQRVHDTNDFRFAVLCSGFSVTSEKFGQETICCPSLHVFGDGRGRDRQIDCEESRKLADLFEKGSSVIIEHDMGHIIPTQPPSIDQTREFLQRFL